MKSMEFTKASIEKAVEAINKHNEEFETIRKECSNLSIEETAQKLIIDKFGDAQIEAEDVVRDLKKGLENFDTLYKQNKDTDRINVVEHLKKATKDKTEEERKNCYVNILTAIELLNNRELSEDDVNTKMAENAELSTEELLGKIEEVMNSTISFDSLVVNVKDGLNSEVLSKLAKEVELNKDDNRFMAALWLYIEQREKNLKLSDSDFEIPAVELGALAGASVEAIIANNALTEGKMDMATWQKVMKWILGAVIGIALAYVALIVVVNISVSALFLIWSVIGTGTLALLFSMIVTMYVSWRASDVLSDDWIKVLELYSEFYNKHIAGVTNKISSWIAIVNKWIENITEKVKSTVTSNKDTQGQTVQTATNNTNENSIQGEPVMA